MRAACRGAEGLRNKIESQENILRVLRSSLVALPGASACIMIHVAHNFRWPAGVVWLAILGSISTIFLLARAIFCQRLGSAVRSTIDSYLVTSLAVGSLTSIADDDRDKTCA